jgi:DNA repair protein SbcD/Mre11
MRFVLISDVHLDTPFTWASPQAARARRQMIRDTFVGALALTEEVQADAVLIGGDLYEHERVTPDTAAFLRDVFATTTCPVFLAPGNHDWIGPQSVYVQTDWSPNVHVFTEDRLRPHELAAGLTLWGAAHRSPANTDGFLDRGFSVGGRTGIHLALFHGAQRGGFHLEEDGKAPHAPFDPDQLERAGLHHAFLGHFHTPRAEPFFTYPGNPAPLSFGEDGVRGAVIIDVHGDGSVTREWRVVATSQAHDLILDVSECSSLQDIRRTAVEQLQDLEGVARLTIQGELAASIDLHPASDLTVASLGLAGRGLDDVVVRIQQLRPAYDLDAIAGEPTVRGAFVCDVLAAGLPEDEQQRVLAVGLRALDGRDDLEVAS